MQSTLTIRVSQAELLSRLLERGLDAAFGTVVEGSGLSDPLALELLTPEGRRFSATARVVWRRPLDVSRMEYRVKLADSALPDYREWIVSTLAESQPSQTDANTPSPADPSPTGGVSFSETLVEGLFSLEDLSSESLDLPQAGDLVGGKYACLGEIGRGAGTVILRANQPSISKPVSLKLMTASESPAELGDRFLHEARVMASLDTPHVPTVFDFGVDSRHGPFLVMENLRGSTLADLLTGAGRGLDLDDFFEIAMGLAVALDAVHKRGIVHGGLHPRCAWVTDESNLGGRRRYVKLFDFALLNLPARSRSEHADGYTAPEQFDGEAVDQRADLYGLGAMLFRMLTGVAPFQLNAADGFRIGPDPQLEGLVRSLMARSPEQRPVDAKSVYYSLLALRDANLAECA